MEHTIHITITDDNFHMETDGSRVELITALTIGLIHLLDAAGVPLMQQLILYEAAKGHLDADARYTAHGEETE